ncbi:NAD(P)-dependent alcohol dehydrogenase [Mycobacterium sp. CVI_P3]|uniref:NAD(P)-dependent alcohol dehydrogenase n=1 Tax=Mycobacterium pinniadriaticum TaxID=2994102 RepID=A0ABT3S6X3_9MYCO|nr:NAD(P)-dependent alcohol dehydrogenase [Mycobacterium pinniadriaticum]MCX2928887.1 NAD(P)-dependent alcohol dehydrogenase [Mycobacterium pinniadriaticum]MCX2935246.1 NAD(P)-dependent alcohol dehydrogenase [Mycobacterium pinniadriaticum]
MSDAGTHLAMVMNAQGSAPTPERRPTPAPGRGEVLVKVNASSVNYHDMVNLSGLIWGEWPRVPMSDGAGEVAAIGPDVTDFSVGDRVMGTFHPDWHNGPPTPQVKAELPGDSGDGWLQQYRIARPTGLVATPAHLTDLEAATLPCAGVTAWNALMEAGIGPGDIVVTQGTGGVSLFAVQFARALGADVILTSSSDDKLAIGSQLGATHLINYRTNPDWEDEVRRITHRRGADLVVDLGGPATLAQSVRAARMGGTVAVIGVLTGFDVAPIPVADVMLNNIRIIGITVGSVLSFVELCDVITEGSIRPHISHVFDWTDLTEAVRVLQAGEHVGKIALSIP